MARVAVIVLLLFCELSWLAQIRATPIGALIKMSCEQYIIGTTRVSRNGRQISAFLGIPYAEPPLGELRFRSPVPKTPWRGILLAVNDSASCPQLNGTGVSGDEDCLYLNVYAPLRPKFRKELLPVLVSIHGGAFIAGSSSSRLHGPEYFLDQDIILVTLNYRLGILGFLSTGDQTAPGNYGLKDQVLVLKWVQKYIRAFGGDPQKVTLVGQSAGGVSVNLHALSDASKDLFKQYIIQSGSALLPWAFRNISIYSRYPEKVAKLYNCPSTETSRATVECLRQLSVEQLLNTDSVFEMLQTITQNTWGPTTEPNFEDAFLTEHPAVLIAHNKMKDSPFLIGQVRDEGLFVTTTLYADDTLYHLLLNNINVVLPLLVKSYIPTDDPLLLTQEIMKFYFDGRISSDKTTVLPKLTNLITDSFFVFPTVEMMSHLVNVNKNPFYFYNFEYRGTFSQTSRTMGSNIDLGVTHGDDLIYQFPTMPGSFNLPDFEMNEADHRIIDVIIDLWTSFAKHGAPVSNHLDNPYIWKPYSVDVNFLQIGNNSEPSIVLLNSFLRDRMSFWAEFVSSL